MRTIKLSVVALFFFMFLLCFWRIAPDSKVTGQTGGTLSAPTGVIASDSSYSTKVGISWDAIRGATSYRIFRNTTDDAATATDVGTTVAGEFFDAAATAGQTYFYWVRAENAAAQSSFGIPDTGLRAIGNIPGPGQPLNPPPPAPPANPLTATKAALGKVLFWDEQLSSTRTVSCGTCHVAGKGGSDPRTIVNSLRATNPGADTVFNTADDVFGSPGVSANNLDGSYSWSNSFGLREQVTNRKTQSNINAAYSQILFWDGRAGATFLDPITNAVILQGGASLETQSAAPPLNSGEMAHAGRDWNHVAAQIGTAKPLALSPQIPAALQTWIDGRGYPDLFLEAFGTAEVTPARIAMAIATFERTLYTDRAPIDAAVSNIVQLTAQEQRGQGVFNQAQCNACHIGATFSDNQFHYIGVRPTNEDTGRFQVTGNTNNLGEFRTPSLRNVELRAPYFHNGRFNTLEDVVAFYNRGGDFDAPNKDPRVRPRGLSAQQQADLVAFLKRPLTDARLAAGTAPFDRPTLYAESNRVPTIIGTGTTGSGARIPQITALEPPIAGNSNFTVAVSNALGGASSVLVIDANDPGATTTIPATGSLARISVNLGGSGAGSGYGSTSIAIPATAAIIGQTFFGRWYVVDAGANGGVAVSPAFRFTVFGEATTVARNKNADFDGDGKTDISVFRPAEGNWFIQQSSNNNTRTTNFGTATDKLAPADFDGDGKTDVAVYRGGNWYILQSSNNQFRAVQFGLTDDVPQPADFDGDGSADVAVWRPSNGAWYISQSRDGFRAVQFGANGDKPAARDYDGDNKADVAVFRSGTWYIQQSTAGFRSIQFGIAEDKPVAADYDGDGKSDIAVWRPSNGAWYYLRSTDNAFRAVQFGAFADVPAPGDYDGDNLNDFAVFRPSAGNWYILHNSNNTIRAVNWGNSTDLPAPAAIVP